VAGVRERRPRRFDLAGAFTHVECGCALVVPIASPRRLSLSVVYPLLDGVVDDHGPNEIRAGVLVGVAELFDVVAHRQPCVPNVRRFEVTLRVRPRRRNGLGRTASVCEQVETLARTRRFDRVAEVFARVVGVVVDLLPHRTVREVGGRQREWHRREQRVGALARGGDV